MVAKSIHPLMQNRAAGLSPEATRMLGKAAKAIAQKDLDAAEMALISVLALAPNCVEARRLLGVGQMMRGEHRQAVMTLRELLDHGGDDALLLMNLGSALYANGEPEEAMAVLRRACEQAPDFASAWFNLGKVLTLQRRPSGAITALHRALDIDPQHQHARILLADTQVSLGMLAPASHSYREVLRRDVTSTAAWLGLYNLKNERFDKRDITNLKRALHIPFGSDEARVELGFVLARALEDQADYAGAIRAYRHANGLKRDQLRWNAQASRNESRTISEAFAAPVATHTESQLGSEVIFIISMPRAGSSLTEQILASHPKIEGAGELTDLQQVVDAESARRGKAFPGWVAEATSDDWLRLGHEYMQRTAQWRERKPLFVDKNLLNWRLLGAAMAMLPGARVINNRRDPLENCLGCYRQLFATGNHFTYEFDDLVSYWSEYDRLSKHWQKIYPQRVFEHRHELLLAEPEAQVRRLLDFCGLEFDPGCLQFHETERVVQTASAAQVRQPLQPEVRRSDLYGVKLDRLRILLRQAVRANQ